MKWFAALFMLIAFSPAKAQKGRPALNLTTGKTYSLNINNKTITRQNIRGKEVKIETTINSEAAIKVKALNDTVYAAEAVYPILQMKIATADTTLTFSSDKKTGDKPDTASAILGRIANHGFGIKMGRHGKVIAIDNLDRSIREAVMLYPALDSVKKQKITGQLLAAFGENVLKGILETGISVLPAGPLQKNEAWERNSAISYPAAAQQHLNYKLTGLPPGDYTLQITGTMTAEKGSGPIDIYGLQATYDIDGTIKDEITLDKQTGWIKLEKLVQAIQENVEISDNAKMPGGLTIPMMITTELTINGN